MFVTPTEVLDTFPQIALNWTVRDIGSLARLKLVKSKYSGHYKCRLVQASDVLEIWKKVV